MEITQENKKRVLNIIKRTMRLQENAKPGETYSAEYAGNINGITIFKIAGGEVIYHETAYIGANYGTPIEELEKIIEKEEKRK